MASVSRTALRYGSVPSTQSTFCTRCVIQDRQMARMASFSRTATQIQVSCRAQRLRLLQLQSSSQDQSRNKNVCDGHARKCEGCVPFLFFIKKKLTAKREFLAFTLPVADCLSFGLCWEANTPLQAQVFAVPWPENQRRRCQVVHATATSDFSWGTGDTATSGLTRRHVQLRRGISQVRRLLVLVALWRPHKSQTQTCLWREVCTPKKRCGTCSARVCTCIASLLRFKSK